MKNLLYLSLFLFINCNSHKLISKKKESVKKNNPNRKFIKDSIHNFTFPCKLKNLNISKGMHKYPNGHFYKPWTYQKNKDTLLIYFYSSFTKDDISETDKIYRKPIDRITLFRFKIPDMNECLIPIDFIRLRQNMILKKNKLRLPVIDKSNVFTKLKFKVTFQEHIHDSLFVFKANFERKTKTGKVIKFYRKVWLDM